MLWMFLSHFLFFTSKTATSSSNVHYIWDAKKKTMQLWRLFNSKIDLQMIAYEQQNKNCCIICTSCPRSFKKGCKKQKERKIKIALVRIKFNIVLQKDLFSTANHQHKKPYSFPSSSVFHVAFLFASIVSCVFSISFIISCWYALHRPFPS